MVAKQADTTCRTTWMLRTRASLHTMQPFRRAGARLMQLSSPRALAWSERSCCNKEHIQIFFLWPEVHVLQMQSEESVCNYRAEQQQ